MADPDREIQALLDFSELVRDRFGIVLGPELHCVIRARLADLLGQRHGASVAEHLEHLARRADREELLAAVELIAIHETYFYREAYQLQRFARDVLPELATRLAARRRLVLWSAGCSSGEEAYTLAFLVADSRLFDGWEVIVLGSDLSPSMLAHAREAIYGPASFRAAPPDLVTRHFDPVSGGQVVREPLRSQVRFSRLNLCDPGELTVIGRVDVICCRNVLIYFDHPTRTRVLENLALHLAPGGYLLLGHSESLECQPSPFVACAESDDLIYRRPEVGP